jgi:hypothetical protein
MSVHDHVLATQIEKSLRKFVREIAPLPGLKRNDRRQAFIKQVIDSIHRVRYFSVIKSRDISPLRGDPSSSLFDPLKAALLHQRDGNFDEACWLVFLSIHFGKNLRTGWRMVQDIYGAFGARQYWTWDRVSRNPKQFRKWLSRHEKRLEGGDGVARHFGNHRKYQSLSASSSSGTGAAIETYAKWVGPQKSHSAKFEEALKNAAQDGRKAFHSLYRSLDAVSSFGRMAKFDYLAMVGKIGLVAIEPPSTYMQGATGPFAGSKLLFAGSFGAIVSRKQVEDWLTSLDKVLGLPFGMQILEDAICNWQKTPNKFKHFRG